MKLIMILLLSTSAHAEHFKFSYGDKVKMIKNITDDDEFFKCSEKHYIVIGYSKSKSEYTLSSVKDDWRCDKPQPEDNLVKDE